MAARGIMCPDVLSLDVPTPVFCDPRSRQRPLGVHSRGRRTNFSPRMVVWAARATDGRDAYGFELPAKTGAL